jgi:hypothetical protein
VTTRAFVGVDESEQEEMTLTREQVLRARGYDEDRGAHADETSSGSAAKAEKKVEWNSKSAVAVPSMTPAPKRQQRTYDERYRTTREATIMAVQPRVKRSEVTNFDTSASSPETSPPKQSAPLVLNVDVPGGAIESARVVAIAAGLIKAGHHVVVNVDGAHIDVR